MDPSSCDKGAEERPPIQENGQAAEQQIQQQPPVMDVMGGMYLKLHHKFFEATDQFPLPSSFM